MEQESAATPAQNPQEAEKKEEQSQPQFELPTSIKGVSGVGVDGDAIIASRENILEISQKLKADGYWLSSLSGVEQDDYYEVVYHLWNYDTRHALTVKARQTKWEPMASVVSVWPYANWHERETFDMYGMKFEGHPNLKTLLLPEDWNDIPPLRKEFQSENLRTAHRVILDVSPENWAPNQITDDRFDQAGKKVGKIDAPK